MVKMRIGTSGGIAEMIMVMMLMMKVERRLKTRVMVQGMVTNGGIDEVIMVIMLIVRLEEREK